MRFLKRIPMWCYVLLETWIRCHPIGTIHCDASAGCGIAHSLSWCVAIPRYNVSPQSQTLTVNLRWPDDWVWLGDKCDNRIISEFQLVYVACLFDMDTSCNYVNLEYPQICCMLNMSNVCCQKVKKICLGRKQQTWRHRVIWRKQLHKNFSQSAQQGCCEFVNNSVRHPFNRFTRK
jgi:hypothetical protein